MMKKPIVSLFMVGLVLSLSLVDAYAQAPVLEKAIQAITKPSSWSIFSDLARTTPSAAALSKAMLAARWQNNLQFQKKLFDEVRAYYPNYLNKLLKGSGALTPAELNRVMTGPTIYEVEIGDSLREEIDRVAANQAATYYPASSPGNESLSPEEFVKRVQGALDKEIPDCSIELCAGFGKPVSASFGAGCGDFAGTISTSGRFSISGAQGRSIVFQLAEGN